MAKTPQAKPRLEKHEQAALLTLLDRHGFIYWRTSEGRVVFREAGLPDVYAWHPEAGVALWVESKRQHLGKISPEQLLFRAMHPPNAVVIGGEAEVRDWLLRQPWRFLRGPMYQEWHRVRREELAKRKAKAQATKTRKRLGISGRGGQKRKL
jgi:hypothetical protein